MADRHSCNGKLRRETPTRRARSLLEGHAQRSLVSFSIGYDRMPKGVNYAYGYVVKVAAFINAAAGRLRSEDGCDRAHCCEAIASKLLYAAISYTVFRGKLRPTAGHH
jgi:fumarate hydratase class II